MRPSLEELAKARADAQRMLVGQPVDKPSEVIKVLLRATAPPTKDEAIPVMIRSANDAGGWFDSEDDSDRAKSALDGNLSSGFCASIRAQWSTLVHFCGGAREP